MAEQLPRIPGEGNPQVPVKEKPTNITPLFSPTKPLRPEEFPTQEEQDAANKGKYKAGPVVRFIKKHPLVSGGGAVAVAGVTAYLTVPAVHQTVDSLGTEVAAWWNSMFGNKDTASPIGIPQFQPSVPGEYITPATTGKLPQELAKEAGYNILWMNPNDTTGRTIFYDYRGGWGGGIGGSYSEQKGTDGKNYRHLIFLTGQFVRFENISGSKDKYIILKDPKTSNLFQKIRVDFEGKITTTDGTKPTSLLVENLSFARPSVGNEEGVIRDGLGYIPEWSENKLSEILRAGDAVGVGLTWVRGISTASWIEEGNTKTEVVENPFAGSITLHRFGGKGQIEKELVYH